MGGLGNDRYSIQNARSVIIEASGQGNDTVLVQSAYTDMDFTSFTLALGVEIETLTTSTNPLVTSFALIGNEFAQGAATQFAMVTPGIAITAASFDVLVPAPATSA